MSKKELKNYKQNKSCYRFYSSCKNILSAITFTSLGTILMCLDIPHSSKDILRFTRNFIISRMEPMLYLSYSLSKKK